MKIVADRAIPFVTDLFEKIGDVRLCDGRDISAAEVADADALVVRTVTKVDQPLLAGSAVRFIGSATSGHDHVDTDYLQQRGIRFARAPGCNARSVAEYVLSCLAVLAEQRKLNLADMSVGIIGCGHVGRTLFGLLDALGIRCLLNDPPLQQTGSGLPLRTLEEVLSADIITLHVPLTRTGAFPTWHLLDRARLMGLRKDAVLINTARGGVIDEQALKEYINTAPQSAVVLDVWENEPAIDPEMLSGTAIATPHIAGYSIDAKLRGTLDIFQQACVFFGIPADESVIPVLPQPKLERLLLTDINRPLDAVQMAVLASYDVRVDSVALRPISAAAAGERERLFSDLRNNYPIRREFPAMTVVLNKCAEVVRQPLLNLGFRVE